VTVQGLAARVPAKVGVWAEAKAEAGWAGPVLQGRADVVSVPTAENELRISWGSPVMKKAVLNAEVT
jgi:hypothetical protein